MTVAGWNVLVANAIRASLFTRGARAGGFVQSAIIIFGTGIGHGTPLGTGAQRGVSVADRTIDALDSSQARFLAAFIAINHDAGLLSSALDSTIQIARFLATAVANAVRACAFALCGIATGRIQRAQ